MKHITITLLFISTLLFSQEQNINNLDPLNSFPEHIVQLNIGKYGIDTLQCEENLTIYNEFYKQKSYDSALKAWFYLFINSPKRTKNIYIHGATMYKSFIKNETDSIKREILISNLLKIYDQRNTYYPGQEGKVLGLKGSDLYKYRKQDLKSLQDSYDILTESFQIDKENAQARALNYYFQAGARLTSNKVLTKENLIELFSDLSSIIDYKEAQMTQNNFDLKEKSELTKKEKKILTNNEKELKTLNNVRANMEKVLAPHVTCEKLVALYEERFHTQQDNYSWLERAAQLLKKGDCIETQIYFQIAAKLYESNPTPKSAFYMGYLSLKQEDYSAAVDYFSQAVDGEDDSIKKSDYLLYLAKTYAAMGNNTQAKKQALAANNHRSGWGAPFILIGDLYAQTSRSCGENTGNLTNDEFTKRVGYWAAIEKYEYAKKIDYSLSNEANQKIKKYIEQAPDKTSTFQIIGLDQKEYKIQCWYTEIVENPHFSN
jgi:TolA-binding protein